MGGGSGSGGGFGSIVGGGLGMAFGGPMGGAIGSQLGGSVGGLFDEPGRRRQAGRERDRFERRRGDEINAIQRIMSAGRESVPGQRLMSILSGEGEGYEDLQRQAGDITSQRRRGAVAGNTMARRGLSGALGRAGASGGLAAGGLGELDRRQMNQLADIEANQQNVFQQLRDNEANTLRGGLSSLYANPNSVAGQLGPAYGQAFTSPTGYDNNEWGQVGQGFGTAMMMQGMMGNRGQQQGQMGLPGHGVYDDPNNWLDTDNMDVMGPPSPY